MEADISIIELLNSEVFEYEIDYEEWPGIHSNTDKMIMPYNGSLFNLRFAYGEVFKDFVEEEAEGGG